MQIMATGAAGSIVGYPIPEPLEAGHSLVVLAEVIPCISDEIETGRMG